MIWHKVDDKDNWHPRTRTCSRQQTASIFNEDVLSRSGAYFVLKVRNVRTDERGSYSDGGGGGAKYDVCRRRGGLQKTTPSFCRRPRREIKKVFVTQSAARTG
jgi:hypothetical protein